MTCGLAVTDLRWHSRMLVERPTGLINFWTPTPWNVKLSPGTRFGFMLKAPVRKVGGFGHFVRYEELDVRTAWQRWGPANGVETFEELAARIREFAAKRSITWAGEANPVIGCIILADCVFLDEPEFCAPEAIGLPFPAQIVKWKRFERDLILPVEGKLPHPTAPFSLVDVPEDSFENIRRRKRLAQPLFRREVIAAYGRRCALTGSDCPEVLEAAHIQPFRGFSSHHIQNGIALRRDIHRLFDAGLFALETDGSVVLSEQLRATTYAGLAGRKAQFPSTPTMRPSPDALAFHRRELFRP